MVSNADPILGEALKLAPHERAMIVAGLLATLGPDRPDELRGEAEWIEEIEQGARAAVAEARTRIERCAR